MNGRSVYKMAVTRMPEVVRSLCQKHGFSLVSPAEKTRLLRRYWDIPERQVETSVVLAQV